MAKCPNTECGIDVQAGWKRCPECGAALTKKCSACGFEMQAHWKVCPECGAGASGGGITNQDSVQRAGGDIIGGNKLEGDLRNAGGANVGGGIHFNLGAAGHATGAAAELEYEEFVMTILDVGGQLQAARARLDAKRQRLGIPIHVAQRIEQACTQARGPLSPPPEAGRPAVAAPAPPASAPRPAAAPAARVTEREAGEEMLIELPDGVDLELVWIPPGEFMMGCDSDEAGEDEKPVHRVTIAQGFWMGKYPVTQAQWKALMRNTPSNFKGDSRPVECVSWDDCQKFIGKLNGLRNGTFRLPSEAEWEYACRAGADTEYCFGDDEDELGGYAWYDDNSGKQTHPVGQKQPNDWGLYDMHGNVWEWCQDWYHDSYVGAPKDGRAWERPPGEYRVLRGGSWSNGAGSCRAASRGGDAPDSRRNYGGFRVARTL